MKKAIALAMLVCLVAAGAISGCKKTAPAASSQATIAFTDAASDELDLFEVDVSGIVFHKYSGATVSVLPQSTRVDFASLEDFGDLVCGVGLETGYYTGMTLTLDFSNAVALLKGSTTPATLLNEAGSPLTGTMQVQVDFHSGNRPYVTADKNHLFMLDLNLDTAIKVDTGLNQVTFAPIISAEVDPTNPKPILSTAILMSVDTVAGSFVVEKRSATGTAIGQFTVSTGTATVFQVDGVSYTSAPGLTALSGLTMGTTRVFARGTIDTVNRVLSAELVEAGAGVFGNGQDWVEGLVTGRSAGGSGNPSPVLTVLGTSKKVSSGIRYYNTSHTINLSYANTKVLLRGASTVLGTDAINVGQKVLVFGTLDVGTQTLDATSTTGVARMIRTGVYGYVSSVSSGTMTMNAVRFGLRAASSFNFTVGAATEAVASAYTVNVTGLDLTGIGIGTRVRVLGYANPVAITTDANFSAVSVINRNLADLLVARYPTPSATVLVPSATQLTLDLTGANTPVVDKGFDGTVPVSGSMAIRPRNVNGWGIYLVYEAGGIQVCYNFTAYQESLAARISPTSRVGAVFAAGTFNGSTQMDAVVILVVLK